MNSNPSTRKHFQLLCEILQEQLNELKTGEKPALLDTDQVKETLREIYDAVHRLGKEAYSAKEGDEGIQPNTETSGNSEPQAAPVSEYEHMASAADESKLYAAVQDQEPVTEKIAPPPPVQIIPEIVPGLQAARKTAFEETNNPVKPESESTIANRYTAAETLYDRIGKSPQEVRLSEKLQRKPLEDLRVSIGLNERFSFINTLFGGDQHAFYQAIDKLNNSASYETAQTELEHLVATYGWNYSHAQVIEFAELVKRRYGI